MAKGKKDEQWLAKAKESRKSLSELWKVIRKSLRDSLIEAGLPREYINDEIRNFAADQTPEHGKEVEAEREAVLDSLAALAMRGKDTTPVNLVPVSPQALTSRDENVPPAHASKVLERRAKPKTRGSTADSLLSANDIRDLEPVSDGDERSSVVRVVWSGKKISSSFRRCMQLSTAHQSAASSGRIS